jgi:hypothetical protein
MNRRTLTFDSYGDKITVEVVEHKYRNVPFEQLALELVDKEDGMRYCMATRAIEIYHPPSPRHALVKNCDENRGLLEHLERAGIVSRTGVRIPTGWIELDEVIVREV